MAPGFLVIIIFGNYLLQIFLRKRFIDYFACHEDEYATLKVKNKNWYTVKYGYFVSVSNIDVTPKDGLSEYFGYLSRRCWNLY